MTTDSNGDPDRESAFLSNGSRVNPAPSATAATSSSADPYTSGMIGILPDDDATPSRAGLARRETCAGGVFMAGGHARPRSRARHLDARRATVWVETDPLRG